MKYGRNLNNGDSDVQDRVDPPVPDTAQETVQAARVDSGQEPPTQEKKAAAPPQSRVQARGGNQPPKKDGEDPLIGAVLTEDFRVVKAIGFGAYARVYLGEQLSVGRRRVAIKVLHAMHVEKHGKAAMAALKREASYLAMLGSTVFPRILRTGITPGGLPFFAMEFVGGRTIDAILKEEKLLSPDKAVTVMDAVCDGLSEMHGRDVIHRDLKTGNIVMEETTPGSWRVRLLDLGSAKPIYEGEATSFSASDLKPGSPPYLAPETASTGVTNEASDLYSLAAVGYEMLCGIRALHIRETTPDAYISYLKSDKPIPAYRIATVQPEVPEGLEEVITRALSRNPGDRFSSTWEFRMALREASREVVGLTMGSGNQTGEITPGGGVPTADRSSGFSSRISGLIGGLKGRLDSIGRRGDKSEGGQGSGEDPD